MYFYDCNEIVFLRKRLNGMERLWHPRLVLIMGIYSEVEQSNLTDNKSGSIHVLSTEAKRVLRCNLRIERQHITQTRKLKNSGRCWEIEDYTEVSWQIRSLVWSLLWLTNTYKPKDTSRKKTVGNTLCTDFIVLMFLFYVPSYRKNLTLLFY